MNETFQIPQWVLLIIGILFITFIVSMILGFKNTRSITITTCPGNLDELCVDVHGYSETEEAIIRKLIAFDVLQIQNKLSEYESKKRNIKIKDAEELQDAIDKLLREE